MANALATLRIELEAGVGKLAADLQKAEALLGRSARSFEAFGWSITTRFTIPVVAGVAKAIKIFSDFDQAITNSVSFFNEKVTKEMRAGMEQIADDLSTKVRYSTIELAQGYKDLAASGMSVAESMKALPVVARLAQTENMNLAQTTESLLRVQNAMGMKIVDNAEANAKALQKISDTFAAASADSVASIEQLMSAAMTKSATEAYRFGASIEELVAGLAVLHDRGIVGERAGYNLSVVFRDLGIKAVENAKAFKTLGIHVFDSTEHFNKLGDILKDFRKQIGGVSDEVALKFVKALGLNQRNLGMLIPMITDAAVKDYDRYLNTLKNSEGATQRMVEIQMMSFENRLNVIKNRLILIGKLIGRELSEPIYQIVDAVTRFVAEINKLDPEIRKFIYSLTAVITVAGPLGLILSTLIGGVAKFINILRFGKDGIWGLLIVPLQMLGTIFGTVGNVFSALVVRVGASVGILGTLQAIIMSLIELAGGLVMAFSSFLPTAALIAVIYYWNDIKNIFVGIYDWVNKIEAKMSGAFTAPVLNSLVEPIREAQREFDAYSEKLGIPIAVKLDVSQVKTDMGVLEILWFNLKKLNDDTIEYWKTKWDEFCNWFPNALDTAINKIKNSLLLLRTSIIQSIGLDELSAKLGQAIGISENKESLLGNVGSRFGIGFDYLVAKWRETRDVFQAAAEAQKKLEESTNAVAKAQENSNKKSQETIIQSPFVAAAAEIEIENNRKLAQQLGKEVPSGYEEAIRSAKTLNDVQNVSKELKERLFELSKAGIKQRKEEAKAIEKSADALKELNRQYEKSVSEGKIKNLEKAFKDTLEKGNLSAAETLKDRIADAVYEGYIEGHAKSLDNIADADMAAAKETIEKTAELEKDERKRNLATEIWEARKQQEEDTVKFWQNLMENAITGVTFDWKDQLTQLAIGFGSQLMSSMFGEITDFTDMKGVGVGLFKEVFGESLKDLGKPISDLFKTSVTEGVKEGLTNTVMQGGINATTQMGVGSAVGAAGTSAATTGATSAGAGAVTAGAAASGVLLPLLAIAAGVIYTYKSIEDLHETFKEGDTTNEHKAAKIAMHAINLFAPGLGTGMYMTANNLGLINKAQELGTVVREGFERGIEGKLEEYFETKGGLNLFTNTKTGQKMSGFSGNFLMGPYEEQIEAASGWADTFAAGGNLPFWESLGGGLQKLFGIDTQGKDFSGQFGFLLQQNLMGNLDNAKLLLDAMKVSVEDLQNSLMEMGMSGEMSWLQVIGAMNEFDKMAKEGLVDVGNVRGALDQLEYSGGRGAQALQAVKNIAIEGIEAGATTLEQLKAYMVQSGQFTTEEIEQIYGALKGAGIDSMEALKTATDKTLATVVANLDAQGFAWSQLGEQISGATSEAERLNDQLSRLDGRKVDVTIIQHVKTEGEVLKEAMGGLIPEGTKTFASGGIVDSPKFFRFGLGGMRLGLMGEAGPEAILPLQRINGKLGVHAKVAGGSGAVSNFTFNVDARGASPGVELQIMQVIRNEARQAMLQAVAISREQRRREGY